MSAPRCCRHPVASNRADIHVDQWKSDGGGGTSGPSFPRPRSPHPLLPSFCSGGKTAVRRRRRSGQAMPQASSFLTPCFKETAYERHLT
jgi:hypothetical protein